MHPKLGHQGRASQNDYSFDRLYDCLCRTVQQYSEAASVFCLCALSTEGSSCAGPNGMLMQVHPTPQVLGGVGICHYIDISINSWACGAEHV